MARMRKSTLLDAPLEASEEGQRGSRMGGLAEGSASRGYLIPAANAASCLA